MVAVADVDREAGEATVAEVERLGGSGLMLEADVADSSDCRRVVEATVERFGGVDILFNNVGIQPPASYTNVEDTSEAMWDRIIGVNLKSCFLMSKYAIPELRKRGGGVIINTASVQGLQSQPLVPPYAASKGGDTLAHAPDVARLRQGTTSASLAVCPGSIDTPMLRAAAGVAGGDPDDVVDAWGAAHPIGRVGTGQDIANAVLFLASDKASFMTGENVNVDGGLHGARRLGHCGERLIPNGTYSSAPSDCLSLSNRPSGFLRAWPEPSSKVSASCVRSSRCSSVRDLGVSTITVTS